MDATILLETLKIELEKLNRDVEMVDESQLDRLADIYVNLSAEIGVLDRVLEKGFSLDSAEWGKNIVKKSLKRKTEEFLLKRVRCLIDQIVREIASNRDLHKNVEEKRKLLEKKKDDLGNYEKNTGIQVSYINNKSYINRAENVISVQKKTIVDLKEDLENTLRKIDKKCETL